MESILRRKVRGVKTVAEKNVERLQSYAPMASHGWQGGTQSCRFVVESPTEPLSPRSDESPGGGGGSAAIGALTLHLLNVMF